MEEGQLTGTTGAIAYRRWEPDGAPRRIVLIAHGYAEHVGRYDHVARALAARGALVAGPDHQGHGHSEGDRVLIREFDDVVADLHALARLARETHPDLPVVLIGHSMGGLIATRYAQRHGDTLAGLVLSGPVLGEWVAARDLLAAEEIPDVGIDPDMLSRDPEVGRAYLEDPLVYTGRFRRQTLAALVDAIERADDEADRVRLPVLYLHGEDDQLVPPGPPREAVSRFASADVAVRVYPGARHEIFNETNAGEVIETVAEFVERVA